MEQRPLERPLVELRPEPSAKVTMQQIGYRLPITGFPSMTVPIDSHENRMPIGAYWIARRCDEATLLRITYAAECLLRVECVPEMLERLQMESSGHAEGE